MKLSVVVPAYNEEKLLGAALGHIRAGLEAFRRHGWQTEIVVCDNNSTDSTADIARAAGVRVVFEPVNQIARARNTGAAHADGDWLLFVDADSAPGPALFDDMRRAIESRRCVGGGSTIAFPQATRLDVKLWVRLWNAMSRTLSWAAGSFLFCEARVFRAVGGFSHDLFAAEELDLAKRVKRYGRFVILHRHPLVTSDRKARLYRPLEHMRFFLRFVTSGARSLRRREDCFIWYDGRR